jgi:hypothetical protein
VFDVFGVVTQLVSVNRTGTNVGNGPSYFDSVSADGRFVSFSSEATDLVANTSGEPTNGQTNVFVRDLQTETTTLVSVNRTGTNSGNGASGCNAPVLCGGVGSVLSANGRFVAFTSIATDLVANDTNGQRSIFVRDLQTGTTILVSVNRFGTNSGNGDSGHPNISADGRFVTFDSNASDLAPNDNNGSLDVFVRDLQTETTSLVSVNAAGTGSGNAGSAGLSVITPGGRFVVFNSGASDLVANDNNGTNDVFLRDLQAGTTTLVSVNRFGTNSGNQSSAVASVSADGRYVAFQSNASDLVANDTNGKFVDVFVRDIQMGVTTLVSVNKTGTGSGNNGSGHPWISADGRFVVFESGASDLVANDTNADNDVFVRDLQTGTTSLVSVNRFGTNSGNGPSLLAFTSFGPRISADDRIVAFLSAASDLVANNTNGGSDVFVRDLQTGTTTLVSVNLEGTNSGNNGSGVLDNGDGSLGMSADGRIIAFSSDATDLVSNDTNPPNGPLQSDVFARPVIKTDVTPPRLTVVLSPTTLWPPNHELVPITATITVSDDFDPNPKVELVSIVSNEPDGGLGDGDTSNDIQGAAFGTDDRSFLLRAERSGNGSGRIYTVTYRATDASGNSRLVILQVVVPKNQGKP